MALEYAVPAGSHWAISRPGAASILPGGRVIAPLGRQYPVGPGCYGMALSPDAKLLVTANTGPERFSLSILQRAKTDDWQVANLAPAMAAHEEKDDWRSVFMGLAFSGNHSVYVSEGNSGRVRLLDLPSGSARRIFSLNQNGATDSYTGALALDTPHGLLYVLDQANFRMVAIDLRRNRALSTLRLGRLPFDIALSPDGRKAWVTNIGMFEYQPIAGANAAQPRDTGLSFPAFGFPSPESRDGVRRPTARGEEAVPGLGDPNVREANSVCVVNLENPAAPRIEAFLATGRPFGQGSHGGSAPSGILAAAGRVFVSNSHNDSITVIDPVSDKVTGDIELRVPGLEPYRGILPIGMAYDSSSGWLLVAEAGINAVGVIDVKRMKVIGHLPAGWFPTRILIDSGFVYVSNAKGQGTGPNARHREEGFLDLLHHGSVSVFPLPDANGVEAGTATVLAANGFRPRAAAAPVLPPAVRHVVLIVKENRTFDEVLGDEVKASNGPVAALPVLARFGKTGYVDGLRRRLSIENVNVTPNHHAIAETWSFSDNFYADSEVSVDGHHWLVGAYPDVWTESSLVAAYAENQKDFRFPTAAPGRLLFAGSNASVHPEEQPEAGTLWHHLEGHGISFRNFGEGMELAGADEGEGLKPTGARYLTNIPMPDPLYRNTSHEYPMFNMNIPDQYRADQFIQEIQRKYEKGGEAFPQFIFIHLPNDHMTKPRPRDGYPFEASYVADNDYALGRIVEYLSHSPWWKQMAIFITEDDAQGGRDHIDSHRTVLLAAGPYLRKNHVSHVNASFPALLKTIFRLLGVPPLNLFDAAASDLSDCFTSNPDFAPYEARPEDGRIFDPKKAREPLDPEPSIRMDDPRAVRELRQ